MMMNIKYLISEISRFDDRKRNGGNKINVHMSEKNVMGVKKYIFGNLLHVVVKMRNI